MKPGLCQRENSPWNTARELDTWIPMGLHAAFYRKKADVWNTGSWDFVETNISKKLEETFMCLVVFPSVFLTCVDLWALEHPQFFLLTRGKDGAWVRRGLLGSRLLGTTAWTMGISSWSRCAHPSAELLVARVFTEVFSFLPRPQSERLTGSHPSEAALGRGLPPVSDRLAGPGTVCCRSPCSLPVLGLGSLTLCASHPEISGCPSQDTRTRCLVPDLILTSSLLA